MFACSSYKSIVLVRILMKFSTHNPQYNEKDTVYLKLKKNTTYSSFPPIIVNFMHASKKFLTFKISGNVPSISNNVIL